MNKNVTTIWNKEFEIVKNGLSEEQVVTFVNELISEQENLLQRQGNLSSLTKLAERTVTEAQKLADEIKKEATDKANEEVSKIIAEAEKRAEQIFEEKGNKIITDATQKAEQIKADAQREADQIMAEQKRRIKPELKAIMQNANNQLISDLERLKGQVSSAIAELEPKLFPPEEPDKADDTSKAPEPTMIVEEEKPQAEVEKPEAEDEKPKAEEEKPESGDKEQSPAGQFEARVELEFLPPADLLQILEIDRHLETLPEVEATEIIPIEEKPVITVFLREPTKLIEKLSSLPEISQVAEEKNGESADGTSSKLQVTLTGSPDTNKDGG